MYNLIIKAVLVTTIVIMGLFAYKTVKAPFSSPVSVVTTLEDAASDEKLPISNNKFDLSKQKEQIGEIIREYLLNNPGVIIEAVERLQKAKMEDAASKSEQYIKDNKDIIESPNASVIFGNEKGKRVVVSFFDYSCGYCRQGKIYIDQLIKSDPNIKVVLRPIPFLGEMSNYVSRIILAVNKMAPNKVLAIHDSITQMNQITREGVQQILSENNLNTALIADEIETAEIKVLLKRNIELASNMRIQSVPTYIIGGKLVSGLTNLSQFQKLISESESEKNTK